MIDFGKILKRSWYILWNYRVLWIFGLLLALTAGGGGSSGNSSYQYGGDNGSNGNGNGFDLEQAPEFFQEFAEWLQNDVAPIFENPSEHVATFIWIGVAIFLLILIFGAIAAFIRYPSEVAVMRMVDRFESTGEKVGFREGWKLGWNRRAFRLWLMDLIISLPAVFVLGALAALGIVVLINASDAPGDTWVGAMIATIGCVFLLFFAVIILTVFLSLLRHFFARFAALEETSLGESFRRGWAFFKHNWKSAALMWLIMLAVGFGIGIVTIIAFFLLIPLYLVLLIPAVIVAAIPGLIVYGIASLFFSAPLAVIVAAIFALPLFFTILFAPLFLLSGWTMIYDSTVWTLTYREMKALDAAIIVEAPQEPTLPA
ncbi:MAG: hypothetical protein HY867_02325 [Chloroflexi bacterium]|nr:hypothetical protein [Chloroflexota bacterium]